MPTETLLSTVDIAILVAAAFEKVGIPYCLTGSVASGLHSEPRFTNDIDFVVELRIDQIQAFVAALGDDFDVDDAALAEAVRDRGSWNIFYLPLSTKIDLFLLRAEPFERSCFARRRLLRVRADGAGLFCASAEDSILSKLQWWRAGGCVSDLQWRDLVHVLRVNRSEIDSRYLDHWADELGLEAELARARREAAAME